MSLNIKNEATNRLINQLAAVTGESKTTAVRKAVEERLARLERKPESKLAERLLAIGQRCASRFKAPHDTIEHGDLLYDESGLPK